MTLTASDVERLIGRAVAALEAGRPAEARRDLEAITATGRANVQIWLMLAVARYATGDWPAAEAAADTVLAHDPGVVRAVIIKGDCRAAVGANAAAIRQYRLALEASAGRPDTDALASELRRAAAKIEELAARSAADLDAKLARAGLPDGPRSARFQQSLDLTVGRKDIYFQQPTDFFFPGLPQVQYFEPADFAWAAEVERATGAIRDELRAVMADKAAAFRPYVHSNFHQQSNPLSDLMDKPDWSTLFLVENGQRNEDVIARCPCTWAAIQPALAWIDGASPTAMFSLLKAGARIRAHTGMMNTRLTCHLPLIVPAGCGFRVGNETRAWEPGKLLIFDDTIEHEAWNDSSEDRVVLIFDVWRPELSERERIEVVALLKALQ